MNNIDLHKIYKKYFSKKYLNKYTISYIETDYESKYIELNLNDNKILIDYKILCSFDKVLHQILLGKDMIIIDKQKIYNQNKLNSSIENITNITNIHELEKVLFKLFPNKLIYDSINNLRIYYIVEKIIRI